MTNNKNSVRILIAAVAFALSGAPEALAQTQQQAPTTTQQPAASQDATQQQAPQASPNAWPTQDSTAPATTTPQQPATPAPSTTAPQQDQQQPQEKQRVVLGPKGQTQAPAAQSNRGTTVDPSAGPLVPTPNTQTNAPTATPEDQQKGQEQAPNSPQPQTEMTQKPSRQQPAPEPLGTAAAESVRTAGNGASKPAGAAVAPAKQHRMRSMLIKLGAVAAVGAAVGSVYALSRGTPSMPPGTTSASSTK